MIPFPKHSFLFSLFLLLGGLPLHAEIVTVNFQNVFEEFIELKIEDQKLRQEVTLFQQEQQVKVQSLQLKQEAFNELRNKAAQPEVSEQERKDFVGEATQMLEELNREEQELRQERAQFQKNLEEKGMRLRRGIVEKVNAKISEMAEQQGWELVLDTSAKSPNGLSVVAYSIKALDKTELVIRELNESARVAPAPVAAE